VLKSLQLMVGAGGRRPRADVSTTLKIQES
jgi:hypothetical protein